MQATHHSRKSRSKIAILLMTMALFATLLIPSSASAVAVATCAGRTATRPGVSGTSGNDVLIGTPGDDFIRGRGGNDIICGGGGRDRILGGDGNDIIYGGADPDRISGQAGNDQIYGGVGSDTIWGGIGSDFIRGEGNSDTIWGDEATSMVGDAADTIYGDTGNDTIYAGSGNDTVYGGIGTDVLNGMGGHDTLRGDDGPDTLQGNSGDDKLYGGAGNDKLGGSTGHDYLYGEHGADTINGGDGNDWAWGGTENDVMHGGNGVDVMYGEAGDDSLIGAADNDWLRGGADRDFIDGGAGNDDLEGSIGADNIKGGSGDDDIDGGSANDTLDGQDGNDLIKGVAGNDTIYGGTGNDTLNGDAGLDRILGGSGNDTINGGDDQDRLDGQDGHDRIEGGNGSDTLRGGNHNDVINGGSGNDVIDGDAGNDTINGMGGSDTIRGGLGDDSIQGSHDFDNLSGGDGHDKVWGNGGDDTVNGDAGNDTLYGGDDDDTLNGGPGVDTLNGGPGNDGCQGETKVNCELAPLQWNDREFYAEHSYTDGFTIKWCCLQSTAGLSRYQIEVVQQSNGWSNYMNESARFPDGTMPANGQREISSFQDNGDRQEFALDPNDTYLVKLTPVHHEGDAKNAGTLTLTAKYDTGTGTWRDSRYTGTPGPPGGQGPINPGSPFWNDDALLSPIAISPYFFTVEWSPLSQGFAAKYEVQVSDQTGRSDTHRDVPQGSTFEVGDFKGAAFDPLGIYTVKVTAIDPEGARSNFLSTTFAIPNWNQSEEQPPGTLGSAPVYGPPPIGWVANTTNAIVGASAGVDADTSEEVVSALYTAGSAVDANGFVDTVALFGGSDSGFLDQPAGFALAMQGSNYPVREDRDLINKLGYWDIGGGRIYTATTRMACMELSDGVLGIVEGIPAVPQLPATGPKVTICRHLTGEEEVAGQGMNWWVPWPGSGGTKACDSSYGCTIYAPGFGIFEGCDHDSRRDDGRVLCDYKVIGGYSVNFGVSEHGGPTLGYVSAIAVCAAYPVQVFAATQDGLDHGFDPCGLPPERFDSAEALAERIARLALVAPQVEYLLPAIVLQQTIDQCQSECRYQNGVVTDEYRALVAELQSVSDDFRANGGCTGIPRGFVPSNVNIPGVNCEGGSGGVWEILVDLGIGVLCNIVTSGAGGVAIAACDAIAAAAGRMVRNMIEGNSWHEGVLAAAAIGGGASAAFSRMASGFRNIRALRLAARICGSFSADTNVLMADGSHEAISEIEVGDFVLATDPEADVTGPRQVTAVWPHEDILIDLRVDGGTITTTEDHKFWNVTDHAWQEAQHLDPGDVLLQADGETLEVDELDLASSHWSTAYDLTVDDLHTFYVSVSDEDDVLVHNVDFCAEALLKAHKLGGGHHMPGAAAWKNPSGSGYVEGYSYGNAPAIPDADLEEHLEVIHRGAGDTVTNHQNRLYREFREAGNTTLSWAQAERIEIAALVAAGADEVKATLLVQEAIRQLKAAGVPSPARIPGS